MFYSLRQNTLDASLFFLLFNKCDRYYGLLTIGDNDLFYALLPVSTTISSVILVEDSENWLVPSCSTVSPCVTVRVHMSAGHFRQDHTLCGIKPRRQNTREFCYTINILEWHINSERILLHFFYIALRASALVKKKKKQKCETTAKWLCQTVYGDWNDDRVAVPDHHGPERPTHHVTVLLPKIAKSTGKRTIKHLFWKSNVSPVFLIYRYICE